MATILTDKKKRFREEYLVDSNATQAAIRAGYSKRTAYSLGQRLLKDVEIMDWINKSKAEISKSINIDAEYVLRQSVKLHERCMNEISPVMVRSGKDLVQDRDKDGNLLFKFDASGAAKGLELIGKHVHVQSFNEKKTLALDLDNATREELEAELALLKRD